MALARKANTKTVYAVLCMFIILTITLGVILINTSIKLQRSENQKNSQASSSIIFPAKNSSITTDKELEPDNTIDEAFPLQPGVLTQANLSASGDKDFYRISVTNPTNLIIILRNLPKQYELDVYDPNHQVIGKSVRQGFANSVSEIAVTTPGKYYIEIIPQYGDFNQPVPYSIEVDSDN